MINKKFFLFFFGCLITFQDNLFSMLDPLLPYHYEIIRNKNCQICGKKSLLVPCFRCAQLTKEVLDKNNFQDEAISELNKKFNTSGKRLFMQKDVEEILSEDLEYFLIPEEFSSMQDAENSAFSIYVPERDFLMSRICNPAVIRHMIEEENSYIVVSNQVETKSAKES